ncbi:hypothetical protein B0J11DRAFT_581664 [Dendryphion nanum]|uniref:Uncharacterized protein n=1 Tax=Dendryphion nanum TaxID=256645 RepID=A0A9P9DKI9_9PLEO|nr:hypothetical protein B0J11DRAFT_581664 [Dendryphion nanum]
MPLSVDNTLALLTLIVTLPPTIWLLYTLYKRRQLHSGASLPFHYPPHDFLYPHHHGLEHLHFHGYPQLVFRLRRRTYTVEDIIHMPELSNHRTPQGMYSYLHIPLANTLI